MPRLTRAHLEQIAKGPYLRPVLEERYTFQVAGVMTLVQDERSIIAEIWDLLDQELANCVNPVEAGDCYGIAWYSEGWEDRGYLYMAAVEIRNADMINPVLVTRTIPALACARFIHKGSWRELPLTLDYVFHTWLPKSGKKPSLPMIIEQYSPDFSGADRDESEIGIYLPIEE